MVGMVCLFSSIRDHIIDHRLALCCQPGGGGKHPASPLARRVGLPATSSTLALPIFRHTTSSMSNSSRTASLIGPSKEPDSRCCPSLRLPPPRTPPRPNLHLPRLGCTEHVCCTEHVLFNFVIAYCVFCPTPWRGQMTLAEMRGV